DDDGLVLRYAREGFVRETRVTANAPETRFDRGGIAFTIRVEPQGEWTTCLDVVAAVGAYPTGKAGVPGHGSAGPRANGHGTAEEWLAGAPTLWADWRALELVYERSLVDLAALRFYPAILPGKALPAAGLPWFMTVFGRDSLITSYQALP